MADKKFRATDSKQEFFSAKEAAKAGVIQTDQGNEETHTFACDCGFVSSNWPTKKAAQERAQQHKDEHVSGKLMEDIDQFLAKHTKGSK